DRNGVRTPMQWNNNRNAGFSATNPQQLYLPLIIDPEYHHSWLNVENQERSKSSFLSWMRKSIAVRRQNPAFGVGGIKFLQPANSKVLAFVRETKEESILVLINLSRHCQYVELDLSEYDGCHLKDLFSQNPFGTVQARYNSFSLTGYSYLWLNLEREEAVVQLQKQEIPSLTVSGNKWDSVLLGKEKNRFLNDILPVFLKKSRWFRSKAEQIKTIQIQDLIPLSSSYLVIFEVIFLKESVESYVLPISFVSMDEAYGLAEKLPQSIICKVILEEKKGVLIDAIYDENFRKTLVDYLINRKKRKTKFGTLSATSTSKMIKVFKEKEPILSKVVAVEQTNSSIIFDDILFLKLFRKIEPGISPDQELVLHLSEKGRYPHVPNYAGGLQWDTNNNEQFTLALMQEHVKNEGELWIYLIDSIKRYYDDISSKLKELPKNLLEAPSLLDFQEIPEIFQGLIGWMVLDKVTLLGRLTAEMHIGLASGSKDSAMSPENFTIFYQKSLYQAFRGQIKKGFSLLKSHSLKFSDEVKGLSDEVLEQESLLLKNIAPIADHKISSLKIRIHGDFHLGQVLVSGNTLTIIDFEGEPAIPLTERKLKRSPIQDVAGMIRSFYYVSSVALEQYRQTHVDQTGALSTAANLWFRYVAQAYLKSYLEVIDQQPMNLVPKDKVSLKILLNACLINKAVYEMNYELQNRPGWIKIPLNGLLDLVGDLHEQ
ncbi:MAG: putative maltokinase, partial [Waddliaceae bacterium]